MELRGPRKLTFWGVKPAINERIMSQDIGAIKVDKAKPVPKTIVISTSLWVHIKTFPLL